MPAGFGIMAGKQGRSAISEQETAQPKRKRGRPRKHQNGNETPAGPDPLLDATPDIPKIPYTLANIIKLRMQGANGAEIGRYFGVTKQTISERIQGIWDKLDHDKLEAYRVNRVNLLEAGELEILSYMGKSEVLAKASGNNLAYMFTQLHTARRLESDLSTSNVALHTIVEQIEQEERSRRSKVPAIEGSPDGK